ncbi:MAG: SDR family oxidoreductase [Thermoplasmatota archaeon]
MERRFEGRVVVVTGASSGIGAAVARRFGAEGASVALGARRAAELAQVAKRCGERAAAFALDVRDPASVDAFHAAVVSRFGPKVDVVVNNAGVGYGGSVEETTLDTWRETLETNLTGPFLVAKAFLPALRAAGPHPRTILNVASASGTTGQANLSAYCASKFGLRGLSQSLALEVSDFGIRVVAVNPGYVATAMVDDAPFTAKEMASADDVAHLMADLAALPASVLVDEVAVWPTRLYSR